MKRFLLVIVTLFFLFNLPLFATSVEDIINNPGNYSGEAVSVEGVVIQYVEGNSSTTSYYILKGYYGGKIKVNTASPKPEINKKYNVSGIVYIDPISHQPFISEQSKSMIDIVPSAQPIGQSTQNNNQLILLLAFLGLIIILGILFYLSQRRKNEGMVGTTIPNPQQIASPSIASTMPSSSTAPNTPQSYHSIPSTIKMPQNTENKTLKFVPGKLVIKSGIDKGKVLAPLQAFPTSNGAVITIGRENVQGERSSAHLKIDDSLLTVSRMQAELIYKNNKVFLKNLSKANYTELDGYALRPNETKELHSGANIKMGELRLQYIK